MTNKQLHIGIDLALKVFNPTLLSRLLPQEKDYILNKQIMELIHNTAEDARHSISNNESYTEISNFYAILEPYLISKELQLHSLHGNHNDYNLPVFEPIITNNTQEIMCGVKYKVEEVGTLNTDIAYLNTEYKDYISNSQTYIENDIFEFPSFDAKFETFLTDTVLNLFAGITYQLVRNISLDLSAFGLPASSPVGTIFKCTATGSVPLPIIVGGSTFYEEETCLRPLGITLDQGTGIKLVAIKNYNVFEHITVDALIDNNIIIDRVTNPTLIKGKTYKVSHIGYYVDLIDFGSAYNYVEDGYTFVCTKDGNPQWDSILVDDVPQYYIGTFIQLEDVQCRLVKPNDIKGFLNHEYLGADSGPLYTLNSGKVSVYHDNKYTVDRVTLLYVRQPITLDSDIDIETDLNPSLHPNLVTLAVKDIISTSQPNLYNTVNAQSQTPNK